MIKKTKIMVKTVKYIGICLLSFLMCGCAEEERVDEMVTACYHPLLDAGLQSRSLSKAERINHLIVVVCDTDNKELFRRTFDWSAGSPSVRLQLAKDKKYRILFWAQCNNAYEVGTDGVVTADYSLYAGGGFERMEELDAFCALREDSIASDEGNTELSRGEVILTRPLAQLNVADFRAPDAGMQAEMTLTGMPVSYNPFTGVVDRTGEQCFSFSDFPSDILMADGTVYHYTASAYLFPVEGLTVSYRLRNGEKMLQNRKLEGVKLTPNGRTNILTASVDVME